MLISSDVRLEQDATTLEALNLRLSWVERRRLEQELEVFSLTLPQYMTLRCIRAAQNGCSMTELASSCHQLTATMTGIVDRLVERGLVSRSRDPHDRRSLRVALTQAGLELMETVSQKKQAALMQILSTLTPEERSAIIAASSRYLSLVETAIQSNKALQD